MSTSPKPAQKTFEEKVSPEAGDKALAVEKPEVAGTHTVATLPVIQESLEISKRVVANGGYRVTKQVSSREVKVDELLRDEQVMIERRAIGETLSGLDLPMQRYEGDVLVIPVVREIAVVEKRLMLVEEIRITRVSGTHRRPEHVTLRSEEILIEPLDGQDTAPVQGP